MTILLIEDEPEIAAVVKEGLEEAHYLVDLARDGVTGLELIAERNYALVILDLMLPRLDGWRVCQEVRARRNTVPILMLTARDAVTDRVRGLEMGADDYLPKPFDFAELLARELIQDQVWMDEESYSNTVDVHVMAVRKKIDTGHEVKLIHSVYGLGYMLKGPGVEADP